MWFPSRVLHVQVHFVLHCTFCEAWQALMKVGFIACQIWTSIQLRLQINNFNNPSWMPSIWPCRVSFKRGQYFTRGSTPFPWVWWSVPFMVYFCRKDNRLGLSGIYYVKEIYPTKKSPNRNLKGKVENYGDIWCPLNPLIIVLYSTKIVHKSCLVDSK